MEKNTRIAPQFDFDFGSSIKGFSRLRFGFNEVSTHIPAQYLSRDMCRPLYMYMEYT